MRALAHVAALLVLTSGAQAETATVAVASNFATVAERLGSLFEATTGHEIRFSFGSTGQLYAQAVQGAPFEVLLAADAVRPGQAVADGIGVAGSVFTYAIGALALYSTSLDLADGRAVLVAGQFDKLAIADPVTAPYGRAAVEVIAALGLAEAVAPRQVVGENITQVLQFVETGNAELGFVAASQVTGKPGVWLVPAALHAPIRQDAVLLKAGKANPAATAFLDFLQSEAAVAVIEAAGYIVE